VSELVTSTRDSRCVSEAGANCLNRATSGVRIGVAESCFAAALLVFGAMDGLGKWTHPDAAAKPSERFKFFLQRMGPAYAAIEDELVKIHWELR
jgi:hypothetical protein